MNPFEWSERDFKSNFRLTHDLALQLIDDLYPHYWEMIKDKQDGGSHEIAFELKVLVALKFYATGCYQGNLRESLNLSLSSVSRSIEFITDLIISALAGYVSFPLTEAAKEIIEPAFREKGFPGVIGCIDGTHIAISGVNKEEMYKYMNRKQFASINVQVICDANYRLLNVNPKFCGANHDSYIWSASKIKARLMENYDTPINQKYWLLGDSGYPLEPWLMTPIQNPSTESEEKYNMYHIRVRGIVERTIGIWKQRFRCILGERKLHYEPTKCRKIILATAILHNYLIDNLYEDDDVIQIVPEPNIQQEIHAVDRNLRTLGLEVRQSIINNYFQ